MTDRAPDALVEALEKKSEALDVIEQLLAGFALPRPRGEDPKITRVTRECHVRVACDVLTANGRDAEWLRAAAALSADPPAPRPDQVAAIREALTMEVRQQAGDAGDFPTRTLREIRHAAWQDTILDAIRPALTPEE